VQQVENLPQVEAQPAHDPLGDSSRGRRLGFSFAVGHGVRWAATAEGGDGCAYGPSLSGERLYVKAERGHFDQTAGQLAAQGGGFLLYFMWFSSSGRYRWCNRRPPNQPHTWTAPKRLPSRR